MKPKTQYCIKSCPTDDTEQLQLLLNTMAAEGWDLYTMQEAEGEDEGYQINCIFVKETTVDDLLSEDYSEYFGFKTKMERIMSPKEEPLDVCLDIQKKIKEQRAKISRIKSLLDSTSEDSRKQLNDEISVNIKELDNLKKKLFKAVSPDVMYGKIGEDKLAIELSEELTELINPDCEVNLISKIVQVRQNLAEQIGYVIPDIKLKNGDSLQANEFAINIRGARAVKSACYPGYIMFFKDEINIPKLPKNTIKDVDPITGKKIVWIEEEKTKDFWITGLDSNEYIARILENLTVSAVEEILDYSDINKYIEYVAFKNLFLIENIIPDFISIGELKYIITSLIKERVSVKDIMYLFEKLNDLAAEPAKEDLLSAVRRAFARQITASSLDKDGVIKVVELSDTTCKCFNCEKADNSVVKVQSTKVEAIIKKINEKLEENELNIKNVVLVLPSEIRQIGFLVFSKFIPEIKVIAKEELLSGYPAKVIATV